MCRLLYSFTFYLIDFYILNKNLIMKHFPPLCIWLQFVNPNYGIVVIYEAQTLVD
jgi:hypothetical protein